MLRVHKFVKYVVKMYIFVAHLMCSLMLTVLFMFMFMFCSLLFYNCAWPKTLQIVFTSIKSELNEKKRTKQNKKCKNFRYFNLSYCINWFIFIVFRLKTLCKVLQVKQTVAWLVFIYLHLICFGRRKANKTK